MSKTIDCPHCHHQNEVPPAGIGRYVTCRNCGSKYYVYVPPQKDEQTNPALAEHATATPQGERQVMMRQESLLAMIHDDLVDLRRRLAIACVLIVVASAAIIATVLLH